MAEPDTLRFALGESGGRSSLSWRIWVVQDGDAYIACRDNYKELKVSLHGTRWRVGLTAEGAEATKHLRPEGTNRAWMVWDRPDPIGGITMGYRIVFFPSESTVTPEMRNSTKWKGVEFVGVPARDWITIVTVTINDPGIEMRVDGAADQAAAFLEMPAGQRLQVTFHTEQLGDDFRLAIVSGYKRVLHEMRDAGLTPPPDGRLFVTGSTPLGHFASEVNVTRPTPDPLGMVE